MTDFNTMQSRYRDQEITDHLKREEAQPMSHYIMGTFIVDVSQQELEEKLEEIAQALEDNGATHIKLKSASVSVER